MKTIMNIIHGPFALFALAWFAFLPSTLGVVPAPDGGYPNGNTAEGNDALFNLYTSQGANNTAVGFNTLFSNTVGDNNTATGTLALFLNVTGNGNTASGVDALASNTVGSANTASGFFALFSNSTGNSNIALGDAAGQNLTTGNNNIDIGNAGVAGESNSIRIGTQGTQTDTYMAGVWQSIVTGTALQVRVNSSGKLGTVPSSARFKEAIKPMDKTSEAVLALQPVTFHYKHELDPKGVPQFGLVAEDLEKVNPDLVARDAEGKPYTVRYDAVNAMLLNEFLKEHRKVEELEAKLTKQEKDFTARLQEQDGRIERVSAQLRLSKSAPRTVSISK